MHALQATGTNERGKGAEGGQRSRGIMRGLCDPPLIISPDGSVEDKVTI